MANLYNVPIPEPTEEGKVLTVVNGEWQAAEGGSGGEYFFDVSGDTYLDSWTTEVPISELISQIEAGNRIVVRNVTDGENFHQINYYCSSVEYSDAVYEGVTHKTLVLIAPVAKGNDQDTAPIPAILMLIYTAEDEVTSFSGRTFSISGNISSENSPNP